MSKHRPSKAHTPPGLLSLAPSNPINDKHTPAHDPWLKRVFHSTYTRHGRRITLTGWAVRIQHAGRRRTFSLASSTKAGAAEEARTIHESICAGGWDTVIRHYSGGRRGPSFPKDDPRWWEERLLLRNYANHQQSGHKPEFSIRIEHTGTNCYFPLATSDPAQASARALAIHRTVVDHGWEAAWKIFPREITIAFRWAFHPLLWTYTTLHTRPETPPAQTQPCPPSPNPPSRPILLLEPDPPTRAAIARCLEADPSLSCLPCDPPELTQPTNPAPHIKPLLCLVNLTLAESIGFAQPNQMDALPDGTPVLSYSVHKDSEELFALTPGGAFAYVLKRTPSDKILEPVRNIILRQPCDTDRLLQVTKRYFHNLVEITSPKKTFAPAQLTHREHEVINLMGKGMIDKEIAQTLGISSWTVHEHVKRIFEKLHVHSRTELVLSYLQK